MQLEIYKPVATAYRVEDGRESPDRLRRPQIDGNAFAVFRNGWQSMELLSEAIAGRLRELGAANVIDIHIPDGGYPEGAMQQANPALLDSIAAQVDGAVFGLGN